MKVVTRMSCTRWRTLVLGEIFKLPACPTESIKASLLNLIFCFIGRTRIRNEGHTSQPYVRTVLHYPNIGQTSNAPCPNLKKLGVPASTTAITAVFVPDLSAIKGCGRGPSFSFPFPAENMEVTRSTSVLFFF